MIDIKNAGATQLTTDEGVVSTWKVTLEGEELYTLPSNFTVQNTFEIRRIIEKMMKVAHESGLQEMKEVKDMEIKQILEVGNIQLDALLENNMELSSALERHAISNEAY